MLVVVVISDYNLLCRSNSQLDLRRRRLFGGPSHCEHWVTIAGALQSANIQALALAGFTNLLNFPLVNEPAAVTKSADDLLVSPHKRGAIVV